MDSGTFLPPCSSLLFPQLASPTPGQATSQRQLELVLSILPSLLPSRTLRQTAKNLPNAERLEHFCQLQRFAVWAVKNLGGPTEAEQGKKAAYQPIRFTS